MFSHLDSRLKQIFSNVDTPFGGISVIVFGDLRQLRPVCDRWIFQPPSHDPYSAIFGSHLWSPFRFFELTEIMRQRDDQPFAIALNNMASGQMSSEDIVLLRGRTSVESQIPNDAIHLFSSNQDTDRYNREKLNSIPTDQFISEAIDSVKSAHISSEQGNRCLEQARALKTSETQGLCTSLILKTTAKYMMTVNVDTSDGLVNGATGVLREIGFNTSNSPNILWIQFLDDSIGVAARSKCSHRQEASWTPVVKIIKSFQINSNQATTIDRKQFPVVPAEAITIHKSQGATYSKVVVHTSPSMQRAALYVACSRATSAAGLYIIGPFVPQDPPRDRLPRKSSENCVPLSY
ncbi:ATP-dependent DNA helicase PIF1-like [Drosophila rhopaloa]|uniref:ATP-dependent DNA helicase n=1 Tax=Drosophila rhopaloa TaxID=1041015 RepID=A0ABM5J3A0_DRORH|nr:ATP-dependent DNA helicase PIF1-like [Drosophila rhopaloa]